VRPTASPMRQGAQGDEWKHHSKRDSRRAAAYSVASGHLTGGTRTRRAAPFRVCLMRRRSGTVRRHERDGLASPRRGHSRVGAADLSAAPAGAPAVAQALLEHEDWGERLLYGGKESVLQARPDIGMVSLAHVSAAWFIRKEPQAGQVPEAM